MRAPAESQPRETYRLVVLRLKNRLAMRRHRTGIKRDGMGPADDDAHVKARARRGVAPTALDAMLPYSTAVCRGRMVIETFDELKIEYGVFKAVAVPAITRTSEPNEKHAAIDCLNAALGACRTYASDVIGPETNAERSGKSIPDACGMPNILVQPANLPTGPEWLPYCDGIQLIDTASMKPFTGLQQYCHSHPAPWIFAADPPCRAKVSHGVFLRQPRLAQAVRCDDRAWNGGSAHVARMRPPQSPLHDLHQLYAKALFGGCISHARLSHAHKKPTERRPLAERNPVKYD